MPRATVNYALAATLIASGVPLEAAAKQTGAKNADSLRVGLARRGVTAMAVRSADGNIQRLTTVATKLVSQASQALRNDLASILSKHTTALGQVPAKPNLKHIRQIGDAIEPLARTAKIVHDWGNQEAVGMVMTGLLDEQKAIDVTADSTPTADSLLIGEQSNSTEPTANTGESVGGSNEG